MYRSKMVLIILLSAGMCLPLAACRHAGPEKEPALPDETASYEEASPDGDAAGQLLPGGSTGTQAMKGENEDTLPPLTEDRLFGEVFVSYEGASPDASVHLENRSEDPFFASVRYYADPAAHLAAGDSLTIHADYREEDCREAGFEPGLHACLQTVPDIRHYIEKPEEVPAEAMQAFRFRADELIRLDQARDMASNSEVIQRSFSPCEEKETIGMSARYGAPLSFPPDSHNGLGLVFRAGMTDSYTDYPELNEESETWYLVRTSNLVLEEDGTMNIDPSALQLYTFVSYDDLYQTYVTANAEYYQAEIA